MKINHVNRFEKLRDGGSLIVSFQSNDSCEYWIMFPQLNEDIENPIFGNPILVNRTNEIEIVLSLEESKQWINKLRPYFNRRPEIIFISKESETEILRKMLELCESDS